MLAPLTLVADHDGNDNDLLRRDPQAQRPSLSLFSLPLCSLHHPLFSLSLFSPVQLIASSYSSSSLLSHCSIIAGEGQRCSPPGLAASPEPDWKQGRRLILLPTRILPRHASSSLATMAVVSDDDSLFLNNHLASVILPYSLIRRSFTPSTGIKEMIVE